MSDKTTEQTAMERFMAALEKRGIEFETNDDECAEGEERTTLFKANLGEGEFDIFVAAKDWYFDGKLTPWLDVEFHNALTPEQAIAATLGSKSVDYMLNTIGRLEEENERLRSSCGTLTAEQVREAVMSADRWEKPMGNTGLTNTHLIIRDDGWQAIADELNAELGSGTCEPTEDGYCPYCGEDLVRCDVGIGAGGGAVELDPPIYHNYCPKCGRRVKR